MLPLFLYPLAFAGLIAVPALVVIYLFRNRFKRHPVSSLMLWLDARESREGGARLRTLQTPLLFLLELLVILALILGAAEPHVRVSATARPVVVVLDDSFSMQAGGDDSPRARAIAALRKQFDEQPPFSIRFILAGERPQILGEAVRTSREAMLQLESWRCNSPIAKLEPALALAGEVGGELALLLVVTDRAPAKGQVAEKGRVQWWAEGKPRGNVAITSAGRTARDGPDRLLIEVTNLSAEDESRTLDVTRLETGKHVEGYRLAMKPGEVRRITLQVPQGTGGLRAALDPDELTVDDSVTLLPATPRPVRVLIRMANNRLRDLLRRALGATRLAEIVNDKPDLLITDRTGEPTAPEQSWIAQFSSPDKGEMAAFSGPFVLDRTNPLTDGLSLKGVVWGTAKDDEITEGNPVVLAGNTVLVTDQERAATSGAVRHHLRIRFRPDVSTVQGTPDWPILIANLVAWRSTALPGPDRVNVRLGEQVLVNLPVYRESVSLAAPERSPRTVPVKGRVVAFPAQELGVWKLTSEDTSWSVAVNALSADESDLRDCDSGRWGSWLDETTLRQEYRGLSWLFLVLLLVLGCVHLYLMGLARGPQGREGS
jgi:hypothetical protein